MQRSVSFSATSDVLSQIQKLAYMHVTSLSEPYSANHLNTAEYLEFFVVTEVDVGPVLRLSPSALRANDKRYGIKSRAPPSTQSTLFNVTNVTDSTLVKPKDKSASDLETTEAK